MGKRKDLRSGGGTGKKGGRGKKTPEGGDDPPTPPSDHSETEATDTAAENEPDKKSRKDSRGKALKLKSGAISAGTSASVGGPPQPGDDSDGSDTDGHGHDGEKSAAATPLKKERADRVIIPEEQELELFQWLQTKPQIWNKDRKFQNFPRADKLKLWQEVAEQYEKTGQFF